MGQGIGDLDSGLTISILVIHTLSKMSSSHNRSISGVINKKSSIGLATKFIDPKTALSSGTEPGNDFSNQQIKLEPIEHLGHRACRTSPRRDDHVTSGQEGTLTNMM